MTRITTRSLAIIVLLTALPPSPAAANGLSAVVNGRSYHFDATYEWNENNVGAGLEYAFESDSRWKKIVFVNGFRDSTDNLSYMAGGGLHFRMLETERLAGLYLDAGINAFLMTREDINGNRPFPGVWPSLAVGNRHMGFNLTYVPGKALQSLSDAELMDPTISGVVFVQFKFGISQFLP